MINFVYFSLTSYKWEFLKISVQKIWCKGTVIKINSRSINFSCEYEFSLKKTYTNYFERVFQEFWPQIKKHILCRTYVLQNSHFWTKLLLAHCGTFLFSKFVCISLLILHARIEFLEESRVVAIESFSIELIEVIVHRCSKKRCFRNIEETYKETPTAKCNFR